MMITQGVGSTRGFGLTNKTLPAANSVLFGVPGTYTWIPPRNVCSVSVVAVGGGGGAGYYYGGTGGGLGYKNNYQVSPGKSYTVVVGGGGIGCTSTCGTSGGQSYFCSTSLVRGVGGPSGTATGGSYTGDGGGKGGGGATLAYAGGGGAGGYSGDGGKAGAAYCSAFPPTAGAGGGGAGGGSGMINNISGGGGGGVGIFGQGSNGQPLHNGLSSFYACAGAGGGGGSGGSNGANAPGLSRPGLGGAYGGGGGSGAYQTGVSPCPCIFYSGANGAIGAVRIVWPGQTRTFPNTNVSVP